MYRAHFLTATAVYVLFTMTVTVNCAIEGPTDLHYVTIKRNYWVDTVTIQQRSANPKVSSVWTIPLTLTDASGSVVSYVMPNVTEKALTAQNLSLELKDTDWLIADVTQPGPFQIEYDDGNWNLLAKALNANPKALDLSAKDLIFSQLKFALSEFNVGVAPVLELLNYARHEDDLHVWGTLGDIINLMHDGLRGSRTLEIFKAFTRELVEPVFNSVSRLQGPQCEGLEKKGPQRVVLEEQGRWSAIETACKADLPLCLNVTHKAAVGHVLRGKQLQDMAERTKGVIYEQGFRSLEAAELDELLASFNKTGALRSFGRVVQIFSTVSNPVVVDKLLKFSMQNEMWLLQYVFSAFRDNWSVREQLVDFLLKNYKTTVIDLNMWEQGFTYAASVVHKKDTFREKFIQLVELIDSLQKFRFKTVVLSRLGSTVHESDVFYGKYEEPIFNWIYGRNKIYN